MDNGNWDIIIIGTGLIESIIASGLSLRGYSVLILDSNTSYGGSWNTIKFSNVHNWFSDEFIDLKHSFETSSFYNKEYDKKIYSLISQDDLDNMQKIHIDLLPKVLFSRGKLVEMIISCDISVYFDFQGIEDIFYAEETDQRIIEFTRTPFSKKEIFSSTDLKLPEKRQIMRLFSGIKNILEISEIEQEINIDLICDPFRTPAFISNNYNSEENDEKKKICSFSDFQDSWKINDKVLNLVRYTIAFNNNQSYNEYNWENDFIKYFNLILKSLNQHNCIGTPFIYPNYGTCDLVQAFSRLAAVKGSTQRLDSQILKLDRFKKHWNIKIQNEGCDEENLKCRFLISSFDNILKYKQDISQEIEFNEKNMLCYFVITKNPLITHNIQQDKKLALVSLNLNTSNQEFKESIIHIFQCDHSTGCCPKGYYIIYLNKILYETDIIEDVKSKIEQLIHNLSSRDKSEVEILYKANYIYKQKIKSSKLMQDGLLIVSDPSINNNSFFLLDEDIEESLLALRKSVAFLDPKFDNEITYKNFSNKENYLPVKDSKKEVDSAIIKKLQKILD